MKILNKDYNCVITIDPGMNGGLVIYWRGQIKFVKMPKDLNRLVQTFEYYREISDELLIVIEKVSYIPNVDDKEPGKAYAIQKLFNSYQKIIGYLEALRIEYLEVHPKVWQARVGLINRGVKETKTEKKNRHKKLAGKIYPNTKITLQNVDAYLILSWLITVINTNPNWFKDLKTRQSRIKTYNELI